MNQDKMTRIEERIAKLEAANRRWRRLATCSVVGAACVAMISGQKSAVTKFDTIEAQRIIVRDAEGEELVMLGMMGKFPAMKLQYPGSRANAMFFTSADHATLALSDQNGASSITLNSGTATSAPNLSMVQVGPGRNIKRLFHAP